MKNLFTIILLISFIIPVAAQIAGQDSVKKGNIEVVQSDRIKELVTKYIVLNSQQKTIEGYRIQIHFGGEREKAREIKTRFLGLFPGLNAYESYEQPNFKIRVGDFRTRREAQKYLKSISPEFPSSYIVNDDILLPPVE